MESQLLSSDIESQDGNIALNSERKKQFQRWLVDFLNVENLLVLCGSGTSLAPEGSGRKLGPTMADLWSEIKARDEGAFKYSKSKVNYDSETDNIEELLSLCQLNLRVKTDAKLANFVRRTEQHIVERCSFVDNSTPLEDHEAFLRRLARRSIRLPRLKLFTTNYDLCFEEAAARNRFVVIDGFDHYRTPAFDGDLFSYDIVRRSRSVESSYISNVFHLLKLHGSVDWDRKGARIERQAKPSNPALIYPRDSKYQLSFDQPYFELMSRFQSALREENTALLVVGFGFNDEHLCAPILSAIASNVSLKLLIVSPNSTDSTTNKVLSTVQRLIKGGDSRLIVLDTTFSEFVTMIPELGSKSEEQVQKERVIQALSAQ